MNVRTRARTAAVGVATVALLGLAACSSDSGAEPGTNGETTAEETPAAEESPDMSEDASDDPAEDTMDPAANLVGPGCEAYAEQVPDGAGSITGMSTDPVAVAASNNPMLTTLTKAVSGKLNPDVNLVDTLNGDEFTVFAPVDDAFAAVDKKTLDTLATDADLLTTVLTYHVVPGQILPEDLPGEHQTVQGDTVEVTGSGDELTVGDAGVVCGGVRTQNATVYLIDSVLMPPM